MTSGEPLFDTVGNALRGVPPPQPPGEQPSAGEEPAPLSARPERPQPGFLGLGFGLHPNFWWGILWCIALLLFTQVPAGLLSVGVIVVLMLAGQGTKPLAEAQSAGELFENPAIQVAVGVGVGAAHLLIILFSLVVLRIVVGRDWTRQVALRRPSLLHTGLVVAVAPAFILLANGTYFVVQQLGFPSFANPGAAVAFVTSIVLALAEMGLVVLILWTVAGRNWHDRLSGGEPTIAAFLSGGLLAGFLGLAVGQYLLLRPALGELFGGMGSSNMEDLEKLFSRWPALLAVVLIGVLPGVSEELWCRGFLGRGLVGVHGYFWGVLLTSFLFGAIHLDPCQGTMALVLGVVLHYVYLTTRSLYLPMLLHFLNNSLAVTLPRLEPWGELFRQPGLIPVEVYLMAGLLLAAVCWALYQSRARLVAAESAGLWQPSYPGVAWPPRESGTRVERPRPSALSLVMVAATLAALLATLALFVRPL